MPTNYINSNMTNQEVFNTFKEQIPEFMHGWFENLIDKADDREAFNAYELTIEQLDNDIDDLNDKVSSLEDELNKLKSGVLCNANTSR